MIGFFIVVFVLGMLILTLTVFRIDYELKMTGGYTSDLFVILLASFVVSLLGMVGITICTVG